MTGLKADVWGNGIRTSTPLHAGSHFNFAQLAASVSHAGQGHQNWSAVTMVLDTQSGHSYGWVQSPANDKAVASGTTKSGSRR